MLELKNICKKFSEFSLDDISFKVEKGDYFILLGESGAGKSMILETIAGLVLPDSGNIFLDGRDITREKIQKRKIGLVFQDHAIFPHMTAGANIGFPLHGTGLSAFEKRQKVLEIAARLEIENLLHRKPNTLSGGELQRISLARTLIQKPRILLLDEPLSSLDTRIKGDIRDLLHKIHQSGQTVIHVTHDYEEALALGNRIAVVHDGKVIQQGEPEEVFSNPASEFVAHFTGAKNFFAAFADSGTDGNYVILKDKMLIRVGEPVRGTGYLLIREEDIFLSNEKLTSSAANNFEGIVEKIVHTSRGMDVAVNTGVILHTLITKESLLNLKIESGKKIWIHFKATSVRFIQA